MEQKNDFSTIMTGRRSVRVYDETYATMALCGR